MGGICTSGLPAFDWKRACRVDAVESAAEYIGAAHMEQSAYQFLGVQSGPLGWTPAHYAVFYDSVAILKLLVESQAPFHIPSRASYDASEDCAHFKEHGNLLPPDNAGVTPLMLAVMIHTSDRSAVIDFLLSNPTAGHILPWRFVHPRFGTTADACSFITDTGDGTAEALRQRLLPLCGTKRADEADFKTRSPKG